MKSQFIRWSASTVGLVLAMSVSATAFAKARPPKDRITMEQARKVATASFPGKVKGEELEFEGGRWIYSFDLITNQDKGIHEIHVDAVSGRLLDSHVETAADEKKEASEEQ